MSHRLNFLIQISSEWKENDRLDVQLLIALCQLSLEKPEQAEKGFTSTEIVQAICEIRGNWSDQKDPEKMSDDVRRYWNKLNATWESKKEGIFQHFQDDGNDLVPELAKTEGGGVGRLSYYRISWIALNVDAPLNIGTDYQTSNDQSIKYICEDITEANWLARIFKDGYSLTTTKRIIMGVVIAIPLIIAWLFLVFFLFGISTWDSIGTAGIIKTLGSLIIVCSAVWTTSGRLLLVPTNKIVLAPWWMQSLNDDRLLEHRHPPRFKDKSVKAVHYTATCPRCKGKVFAKSGGLSFWGRIVGRCENSPIEHIYSFDHVTRKGKALR